jgi:hypothetical protein
LHREVYSIIQKVVVDRGGLQDCETSRIQRFLDNRLTDGDEVVSLRLRTVIPIKIPGTHFFKMKIRPQGLNAAGRIMSIAIKSDDLIGNITRDIPAYSIVPSIELPAGV